MLERACSKSRAVGRAATIPTSLAAADSALWARMRTETRATTGGKHGRGVRDKCAHRGAQGDGDWGLQAALRSSLSGKAPKATNVWAKPRGTQIERGVGLDAVRLANWGRSEEIWQSSRCGE